MSSAGDDGDGIAELVRLFEEEDQQQGVIDLANSEDEAGEEEDRPHPFTVDLTASDSSDDERQEYVTNADYRRALQYNQLARLQTLSGLRVDCNVADCSGLETCAALEYRDLAFLGQTTASNQACATVGLHDVVTCAIILSIGPPLRARSTGKKYTSVTLGTQAADSGPLLKLLLFGSCYKMIEGHKKTSSLLGKVVVVMKPCMLPGHRGRQSTLCCSSMGQFAVISMAVDFGLCGFVLSVNPQNLRSAETCKKLVNKQTGAYCVSCSELQERVRRYSAGLPVPQKNAPACRQPRRMVASSHPLPAQLVPSSMEEAASVTRVGQAMRFGFKRPNYQLQQNSVLKGVWSSEEQRKCHQQAQKAEALRCRRKRSKEDTERYWKKRIAHMQRICEKYRQQSSTRSILPPTPQQMTTTEEELAEAAREKQQTEYYSRLAERARMEPIMKQARQILKEERAWHLPCDEQMAIFERRGLFADKRDCNEKRRKKHRRT